MIATSFVDDKRFYALSSMTIIDPEGGSEYSRKADPGSLPIRAREETEEF
jgi:hypothetical protein